MGLAGRVSGKLAGRGQNRGQGEGRCHGSSSRRSRRPYCLMWWFSRGSSSLENEQDRRIKVPGHRTREKRERKEVESFGSITSFQETRSQRDSFPF